MKAASITGSFIITIALLFYTIGFINAKRLRLANRKVLFFYTVGVTLDITATVFMIIAAGKGMITPHGMIGYSSLLGMLTDTFLLWRINIRNSSKPDISRPVYNYSMVAYIWWVTAYITGGLLVAISSIHHINP